MIPKVIHYCWFGGNPKPKLAKKCIKSWKKYCKGYQIIEWNEENFDFNSNEFAKQAYDEKAWAFVSDVARYDIINKFGGIYFDTDVEVIKNIDFLLEQKAFMGFENDRYVASGLGFGAEKGNKIIKEIFEYTKQLKYRDENGDLCRPIVTTYTTDILKSHGLKVPCQGDIQQLNEITIYPKDYFCPKDFNTGLVELTENTATIHHFDGSWLSKQENKKHKDLWKKNQRDYIIHAPNRFFKKLFGTNFYEKIKKLLNK